MGSHIHGTQHYDANVRSQLKFSDQKLEEIRTIVARYPEGKHKSALLPVLHIAQAEFGGWLSPEVMDLVADTLNITPIEVFEVASFYTMFKLQPVGKYCFEICQTSSCWLNGAEDIVKYLKQKLDVELGQVTNDGLFSVHVVECLGSCGTAPMMQCGASYHENLTYEKIDTIIDTYRKENRLRSYTDLDYKNTL